MRNTKLIIFDVGIGREGKGKIESSVGRGGDLRENYAKSRSLSGRRMEFRLETSCTNLLCLHLYFGMSMFTSLLKSLEYFHLCCFKHWEKKIALYFI